MFCLECSLMQCIDLKEVESHVALSFDLLHTTKHAKETDKKLSLMLTVYDICSAFPMPYREQDFQCGESIFVATNNFWAPYLYVAGYDPDIDGFGKSTPMLHSFEKMAPIQYRFGKSTPYRKKFEKSTLLTI